MLAAGGAPRELVVVVPAIVDDEGVATVEATVESLGFITSCGGATTTVVVGLSFFEPGSTERANETPTPPASTAITVAAIVRDLLLMFWNRFMKFSFEHLEPLLLLQEQPQESARRM